MKRFPRVLSLLPPFQLSFLIPITAIIFVSCATQSGVVLLSEDQLRRGLTINQAESILGQPLDNAGYKTESGDIDVRKYISSKSSKIYQITYLNGRVDQITRGDASEEIRQKQSEVNAKIEFGQSEKRVREIAGPPTHVTGIDFETIWWYYLSDDEIYVLKFRDNVLVNGVRTSSSGLKDFLKQYRKF